MSYTTRFVFHVYGDGSCAVEVAESPSVDTVFTEVLFFCLMVSRTLLKMKQRRDILDKAAQWLDSFRMLGLSILGQTIDSQGIDAELKRISVGRVFQRRGQICSWLICILRAREEWLKRPVSGHKLELLLRYTAERCRAKNKSLFYAIAGHLEDCFDATQRRFIL